MMIGNMKLVVSRVSPQTTPEAELKMGEKLHDPVSCAEPWTDNSGRATGALSGLIIAAIAVGAVLLVVASYCFVVKYCSKTKSGPASSTMTNPAAPPNPEDI